MKKIVLIIMIVTGLYAVDFKHPETPDKELNAKTIEGIDFNNNGVRDDVELYIYKNYQKLGQKNALIKYARLEQEILINGRDQEKYINTTREICNRYSEYFINIEVDLMKVDELILNTNLRKERF